MQVASHPSSQRYLHLLRAPLTSHVGKATRGAARLASALLATVRPQLPALAHTHLPVELSSAGCSGPLHGLGFGLSIGLGLGRSFGLGLGMSFGLGLSFVAFAPPSALPFALGRMPLV